MRKTSKTESRAQREARLESEKRSAAAVLGWERKRKREAREKREAAREFKRRSEAAKLGHARRRVATVAPKIAATDKTVKAKVRSVKAKVAATKRRSKSKLQSYEKEQRKRDRDEIKRLRKELDDLKAQAAFDTSNFVNVVPDAWLREDGSIALNPCRLRHTADAPEVQSLLKRAHERGGENAVKREVKRLAEYYEESGEWPDDDPMTEHEIWTLFFSP